VRPILFRISSQDNSFRDFYESLAYALRDQGRVYTPHPVIPPNVRMAIPRPTHVLVAMNSVDAFGTVYQSMRDYLKHNEERELTIDKEDNTITITGPRIPEARDLVSGFLSE